MNWAKKTTSEEGLKAAISAHNALGHRSPTSDNDVVARNILHGDLGYYSDRGIAEYHLDDETRDRLIAHARQDAALAVLNSAYIIEEIGRLRRRQRITILLMIVAIVLIVWSGK